MPLCFEDGWPYECPSDGRLLVSIENLEGNITVIFWSDIANEKHDYYGLRELMRRRDDRNFTKDGIIIYVVPDPTTPPPEQARILAMAFICAIGRLELDRNYSRVEAHPNSILLAFKPLPPLST
ncbi:MAG: hypothetical protein U0487_02005 [Patescibacteria group bacterium]